MLPAPAFLTGGRLQYASCCHASRARIQWHQRPGSKLPCGLPKCSARLHTISTGTRPSCVGSSTPKLASTRLTRRAGVVASSSLHCVKFQSSGRVHVILVDGEQLTYAALAAVTRGHSFAEDCPTKLMALKATLAPSRSAPTAMRVAGLLSSSSMHSSSGRSRSLLICDREGRAVMHLRLRSVNAC